MIPDHAMAAATIEGGKWMATLQKPFTLENVASMYCGTADADPAFRGPLTGYVSGNAGQKTPLRSVCGGKDRRVTPKRTAGSDTQPKPATVTCQSVTCQSGSCQSPRRSRHGLKIYLDDKIYRDYVVSAGAIRAPAHQGDYNTMRHHNHGRHDHHRTMTAASPATRWNPVNASAAAGIAITAADAGGCSTTATCASSC